MGTAWRKSTRVPALRVPMLLMGLGQAARALRQPSEASTPSESTAPDSAGASGPPGSRSRKMHRDVENPARQGAQSARARQLPRGPRTRAPRGLRDHGTATCRLRRPAVDSKVFPGGHAKRTDTPGTAAGPNGPSKTQFSQCEDFSEHGPRSHSLISRVGGKRSAVAIAKSHCKIAPWGAL